MKQPEINELGRLKEKYDFAQETWMDLKCRFETHIIDLEHDLTRERRKVWIYAIVLWVICIFFIAVTCAKAEPPANADPALAPWFHSLTQPDTGYLCCSVADCRPVKTRQKDGHIEAFIDNVQFRTGPNDWVRVPENVILHGNPNPTGEPIACFLGGMIRCFVDVSGV